jgi:hypothetical protein
MLPAGVIVDLVNPEPRELHLTDAVVHRSDDIVFGFSRRIPCPRRNIRCRSLPEMHGNVVTERAPSLIVRRNLGNRGVLAIDDQSTRRGLSLLVLDGDQLFDERPKAPILGWLNLTLIEPSSGLMECILGKNPDVFAGGCQLLDIVGERGLTARESSDENINHCRLSFRECYGLDREIIELNSRKN